MAMPGNAVRREPFFGQPDVGTEDESPSAAAPHRDAAPLSSRPERASVRRRSQKRRSSNASSSSRVHAGSRARRRRGFTPSLHPSPGARCTVPPQTSSCARPSSRPRAAAGNASTPRCRPKTAPTRPPTRAASSRTLRFVSAMAASKSGASLTIRRAKARACSTSTAPPIVLASPASRRRVHRNLQVLAQWPGDPEKRHGFRQCLQPFPRRLAAQRADEHCRVDTTRVEDQRRLVRGA